MLSDKDYIYGWKLVEDPDLEDRFTLEEQEELMQREEPVYYFYHKNKISHHSSLNKREVTRMIIGLNYMSMMQLIIDIRCIPSLVKGHLETCIIVRIINAN